jgi:chromosome segregation ATPase
VAEKTATYSVRVDSNAKDAGNEGAAALEKLKGSITSSLQAIKDMSASMKSLRGSTDEVKVVKEQLKGKIEAERSALSANNLALLKAGTSYTKLSEETKKAAAESAKHGAESKRLLGPLGELRERFDALKEKVGSAGGVLALFAVGAVAVVATILEIGGALASATKDLVEWIVQAGLANRQMALHREAYSGSAANARALGHELDALAGKVATPRAELEKLAESTYKALNNTRVSGQGIKDTIEAVAQASAAMGDEAGAKLAEIVARAKNTGARRHQPGGAAGHGPKSTGHRSAAREVDEDRGGAGQRGAHDDGR